MATKSKTANGKYRALTGLSLRKAPERAPDIDDPADDPYNQWHEWPAGTEFTPPAHMDVEKALARGIIEPVEGGVR